MDNENHANTGQPTDAEKREFKCKNCGAPLVFKPGSTSLTCPYCGAVTDIDAGTEPIEELDYNEYLEQIEDGENSADLQQVNTITCNACGATTTLDPNQTAGECPFCGTRFVIDDTCSKSLIKPKSILPFKLNHDEAVKAFEKWLKKLHFAPPKLKRLAYQSEKMSGIYIPYWTYDSDTITHYTGKRGTDHTRTVTRNGKTETVTETTWVHVSGTISHFFDDVLVAASDTLPKNKMNKLEPWDLENLSGYNEQFLSGFRSESYKIGLKEGFAEAKEIMDSEISSLIRSDIGGDHQVITSQSTEYSNITFKHTLLPIWVTAYKYNSKVFQVIINGRTGKVAGDRPWCWWKITLLILAIIGVCVGIYFLCAD